MVEAGWGALFSSTVTAQNDDLNLPLGAAQAAWDGRRGAWAESGETLLGYEYRACIKLGVQPLDGPAAVIAEAYQRHCVDLRDLRLVGRFDDFQVPPSQRLWIWEDDLEPARQDLDLPTEQKNRHPGPSQPRRPGALWRAMLTRVERPSLRTPNFTPDGPPRPGTTRVRTAVGRPSLARRRSPAQPGASESG
jgi:hypothetical protein